MAFGDAGGAVTELIITCRTPAAGTVAIAKGDAVKITDAYTVEHPASAEEIIFGQAMAAASANNAAIPVKVRGICMFGFTGTAPTVNGEQGIAASATPGLVKMPSSGNGRGINVKVDNAAGQVHVLL